MLKKNQGFTLIELMIALVIGMFLILGITATYSAIAVSVQTSKELENAQEVIRYSSQVFTRSLTQTQEDIDLTGGTFPMKVHQRANTRSCVGTVPTVAYYETFIFDASTSILSCNLKSESDGSSLVSDKMLLKGITNITPFVNGDLVTIQVLPDFMPTNFVNGINIYIALKSHIFADNI